MTADEFETLLGQVATAAVSPRAAIARLVESGEFNREDAELCAFAALGGSDLVEAGADGRERYMPSGKLVREVEAAMRR